MFSEYLYSKIYGHKHNYTKKRDTTMGWQQDFDRNGPNWSKNAEAVAKEKIDDKRQKKIVETRKQQETGKHNSYISTSKPILIELDKQMFELKNRERELINQIKHTSDNDKIKIINSKISAVRDQFYCIRDKYKAIQINIQIYSRKTNIPEPKPPKRKKIYLEDISWSYDLLYAHLTFDQFDQFAFYIGGYLGESIYIKFDGNVLKYLKTDHRNQIVKITPTQSHWEIFWKEIDSYHVWDWEENYDNPDILDGTQWKLWLKNNGKFKKSRGSNRYPKLFNSFLKTASKLVNNLYVG
jgi:hypothetical protein